MTKIVPHVFAEKSAPRRTNLIPFQRVSDRYAGGLANAIEQLTGKSIEVVPEEVQFIDYARWSTDLGPLSSLSIFRLFPLRGQVMLHLQASMVDSLINVYFGGALGPEVSREKDEFRDTELQLIKRLTQSLMEQLCHYYAEYGPMESALQRHETNPTYITGFGKNEQVMSQPFRIVMSEDISWKIELLYSNEATESAVEFVLKKSGETPAESDPVWQQQWSHNLQKIHLPLRTILAQPTMSLPELFDLKQGDIIPITPRSKPPLFVANHKFATGTVGEKNGCAAFKIEHMEQGDPR